MAAYHEALELRPGASSAIDQGLETFRATFADLTAPDLHARMQALYADEVFFNDTLKTFTAGADVARYMAETGSRLDTSEVTVDHELRDGNDVFVRWTMHFKTSAFGMGMDSKSIGMTHLRFDEEGRVVLHQDFWDAAAGLYEHLPIIGAVLRTAKRMMK